MKDARFYLVEVTPWEATVGVRALRELIPTLPIPSMARDRARKLERKLSKCLPKKVRAPISRFDRVGEGEGD